MVSQLLWRAGIRGVIFASMPGMMEVRAIAKKQKSDENPYDLLLIFEFEDEIDQNNSPGEKDQGFIHIGQRNIAVTRLMRFQPPDDKPPSEPRVR